MTIDLLIKQRDAKILRAKYDGDMKSIPRIKWECRRKIAELVKSY